MKTIEEMLKSGELFEDEKEKNEILQLPEVQREQRLNEKYKKLKEKEMSEMLLEMSKDKSAKIESNPVNSTPKYPECDFILSRDLLMSNIFKPFVNVAKGCFVRPLINGKNFVCKISGFTKIPPYKLSDKTGTNCSVALVLDTGAKQLDGVPINFLSSSNATEEEFNEFIRIFKISSLVDIRKKYESVKNEFSRGLKDSEITKMIEARLRDNPKKKTNTQRKIEIISKRDEAIQLRNKEEALRLQQQLEKIEDEEREERKKRTTNENEIRKKKCL